MKAVDYVDQVKKNLEAAKADLVTAKDMAEKPDNKEHIQCAFDDVHKALECLCKYVD